MRGRILQYNGSEGSGIVGRSVVCSHCAAISAQAEESVVNERIVILCQEPA